MKSVKKDLPNHKRACLNLFDKKFEMCNILDSNFYEQFQNSSVRKEFQELNIRNMNQKCRECNMKYFCGGRCRGETFQERCCWQVHMQESSLKVIQKYIV